MNILHETFSKYVAILGRGPGKSRALTGDEARDAFGMVLRGEPDPRQLGAFLMLLRFRGEDAAEIAGMVQAVRDSIAAPWSELGAALDWPSYGSGRTRGAPWFLLSARALARAGVTVAMHGSNDHSSGIPVESALGALGLAPATGRADAATQLRVTGFTYLPLAAISPALDELLGLRRLFGLRSPVNTVARLVNPAGAPASVDGVFHPPYIAVHLGVAELLGQPRLLVLKGGGGEAERVPLKPATGWLWDRDLGRTDIALPAIPGLPPLAPAADTPELLAAVWRGETAPPTIVATVVATIGLALLALNKARGIEAANADAERIWRARGTA